MAISSKNLQENLPLVSIVTVVYNGERYLASTIESVAKQTYPNIEYIVVDGLSKDRTCDIIREHEKTISFWKSEKDAGLSDAMNKAMDFCHGDLLMYLHADDILEPNGIQLLVESLKKSGRSWAMGFYRYINSSGIVTREEAFSQFSRADMLARNIVRHQSTVVPLAAAKEIRFDTKFRMAMDYKFFLRLWDKCGPPEVVESHISRFRLDGNNLSSDFYASIKDEMRVRKEYRLENGQAYMLPADYAMYTLRWLKIFFYHSRKRNVG